MLRARVWKGIEVGQDGFKKSGDESFTWKTRSCHHLQNPRILQLEVKLLELTARILKTLESIFPRILLNLIISNSYFSNCQQDHHECTKSAPDNFLMTWLRSSDEVCIQKAKCQNLKIRIFHLLFLTSFQFYRPKYIQRNTCSCPSWCWNKWIRSLKLSKIWLIKW